MATDTEQITPDDFRHREEIVQRLVELGLTRLQAFGMANIAMEYHKPERGKWNDNT